MALVAWYPLNGDLESKGTFGDRLSNKGAIVNDFGKIGKCYDTTDNCLYTYNFPIMSGDSSYSIWAKSTKENKMLSGMPYTIGMTNNKYVDFAFLNDRKVAWNIGDGGSNTFNTVYGNALTSYETPIDGNWHHYVVTNNKSSGKATLFVDGNEVGYAYYREPTSTGLVIGEYLNASTMYLFKGLLNDFRAYDHILSKAEIKEIYKTPILKYSFDYPVIDPNISTQTNTDFNSILTGGENKSKKIGIIKYDNTYIVDNNYFTISYDVTIQDLTFEEGNTGLFRVMSYNILADGTVSYSNFISSSDKNGKGFLIGASDGSGEINLTQNGTYHIVRCYQLTNTASMINDWDINVRVDYITGGTLKIENLRVVLGTKEILYDGTNNVFYDETGLGNDGVLIGQDTFLPTSYSTESKIGEGCYVSKTKTDLGESTYGIIKCDNFTEVPEISVCFWAYVPETDKNTAENVFLGYSLDSSKYDLYIYRYQERMGAVMYGVSITTNSCLLRGQWNYIAITAQKVGNIKIYVNGKLERSGLIPSGVNWTKTSLIIGDVRQDRKLGFDGKIDDLIIYATALSENDIKKQYRDVAKIDSDGNLYCKKIDENIRKVEYLESSGSQWIDTGIKPNNTTEFEIVTETLKTGSKWDGCLLGSRSSTGANDSYVSWFNHYHLAELPSNSFIFGGKTYGLYQNGVPEDTSTKHIIKLRNKIFYIDDLIKESITNTQPNSDLPLYLFGLNQGGQVEPRRYMGKLYYCKIWKDGKLVRDFIPIISTEKGHIGEACLFDTVTNTYFYNQGTGKFTTNLDENTIDTNFTGKGIVNTNYFIEGKDIVKVINNENIIETNKIYEN